jgi:hypothetical protein
MKGNDTVSFGMDYNGHYFEFEAEVAFKYYEGSTPSGGDDPSECKVTEVRITNFDEQVAITNKGLIDDDQEPFTDLDGLRNAAEDAAEERLFDGFDSSKY